MKNVNLYMMPAPNLTRCAVTLYPGDCITRTQTMPEESFEHIFTDPSYEDPVWNRARSGTGYGRF
jgi:DNA modification methylase